MATLWPWLALAGFGALHGLNPANGWIFAAAWGVQARDRKRALFALLPLAVGHTASIALVAAAVALGLSLDRSLLQYLAAALLVAVALAHLARRRKIAPARVGNAGLAVWSFMMSSAHGSGLMLVPALMPLCAGSASPAATTASDSVILALAGVCAHTLAMLTVIGALATGACRGVDAGVGLLRGLRYPR